MVYLLAAVWSVGGLLSAGGAGLSWAARKPDSAGMGFLIALICEIVAGVLLHLAAVAI